MCCEQQIYVVVGNCVYFGICHAMASALPCLSATNLENLCFYGSHERESLFIRLKRKFCSIFHTILHSNSIALTLEREIGRMISL